MKAQIKNRRGSVVRSLRIIVEINLTTRFTALLLITALLTPLVYLDRWQKVSAEARFPAAGAPAPVSAPPEAFAFSSADSVSSLSNAALSSVAAINQSVAGGYQYISDSFVSPPLPEGFATAKTPTVWENAASSITVPAASFLSTEVAPLFFAASAAAFAPPAPPPPPLPPGAVRFDFDGDGKADTSRWQPSTGAWKIKNSSTGSLTTATLGTSSSTIAPADYNGDGKTDKAVFDAATATWTIKLSPNNTTQTITSFGQAGDKVASGDYDGDGSADAALWRPSTGVWYVKQSTNGTVTSTQLGASTDIPVPGNYDGDGKMDYAVYRPSNGYWYLLLSGSGYAFSSVQWGIATDTPAPADYDGDGKTDCAVYRASTGTWYVNNSGGSPYTSKTWGNYGDQPVAADYDGDGHDDFAVWRPATGVWYIVNSKHDTDPNSNYPSYDYQTLGAAGDVPVESAYVKQIGAPVQPYALAKARLAPKNATGGTNLYSRNFSWGTGLVGLPGRAGLDAGFGISYNSLVWTKQSGTMIFDADTSNVSPGFRFGFPIIEPSYLDSITGKFAYLMVTPSGGRVEFRQDAATGIYETADSSYAQLIVNRPPGPNQPIENYTLTVTTTGGAQMTYVYKAGAFRCSEIKDRNGNFITIVHDQYGLLQTVTDTLGRIITVNYDSQQYPTSITQNWKTGNGDGSNVTHTYATFSYSNITINTSFDGSLGVFGPPNGTSMKVLSSIGTASNNYTTFEYNGYGQVWRISNYASDNHKLNHTSVNLDAPGANQPDCPRFSETRSYAENFNGGAETVVHNSFDENQPFSVDVLSGTATRVEVTMDNAPHSVMSRMWYYPVGNWGEGLPFATEDFGDGARKRWTTTAWTQDNTSLAYIQNPRTLESKVGDGVNVKKTSTEYYPITQDYPIALVMEVSLYGANQTTVEKRVVTDYNTNSAYLSRRIIGLPSITQVYGLNQESNSEEPVSKTTYAYDETDFTGTEQNISSTSPVIQHDNSNFGASFIVGRGNPTSTSVYNVSNSSIVSSQARYNTAGAVVKQISPDTSGNPTREVKISYTDSFNDTTTSRNTYAYPTVLTTAGTISGTEVSSLVKYRYDIGANVWAKSPAPAGNSTGKETTREFDSIGRLFKETLVNNGAYTRYDYSQTDRDTHSKVYSTVTAGAGEVLSETFADGAGRSVKSRTELPNSTGGWSGGLVEYDILGQVKRSTVPTEINASWQPTGDDYRGMDAQSNPLWLWTSAEYDWKGRATKQTNTDGTDKTVDYSGCGCTGVQTTTIKGEEIKETDWQGNVTNTLGRRTQKIYADIQGRTWKTEVMNWDGTTTYATTVTQFNGRDQAVNVKRYAGAEGNGTPQETKMTYDGFGRLKTQHRPEQRDAGSNETHTTYNYNADGSISSVVDAREASTNYVYEHRGLPSQISYSAPTGGNIQIPATVNYTYDALGNRASMTEANATGGLNGLESVSYAYDPMSRLTGETRSISDTATGFNQSFTFNYDYNLAGQLTSFADVNDQARNITYPRDKIGRVTAVNGNGFYGVAEYATNIQYRAFGAVKSLTYGHTGSGSGKTLAQTFNNRLQLDQFNVSGGSTTTDDIGSQNKYYADGAIKSAGSISGSNYGNTFDRLYKYDNAGRITEAKSGLEARDSSATTDARPYKQTYAYNAFGNLTNRTGRVWDVQADPLSATYTNNRRDSLGWEYDADGRNTYNNDFFSYFDAAGRRYKTSGDDETTQTFDGDGQRIKQIELLLNNTTKKRYYINSSVLGVIYEFEKIGATWVKRVGNVYLNGQQLAVQNNSNTNTAQSVWWIYKNPVTGSTRGSTTKLAGESDPLGVNTGATAPAQAPPDYGEYVSDFILPSRIVDPSNMTNGCQWGGLPISCDSLNSLTSEESRIVYGRGGTASPLLGRASDITTGNSWSLDHMLYQVGRFGSSLDPRSSESVGTNSFMLLVSGIIDAPVPEGSDASAAYATRDKFVFFSSVSPSKFRLLTATIERVKGRLKNKSDCKNLFGNLNVEDYLNNHIIIGAVDSEGYSFGGNGNAAHTSFSTDANGQRVAGGTTTFNQNSFFFTGTVATGFIGIQVSLSEFLTQNMRDLNGIGNLSVDEFRELILLHELMHANDVTGKYDDSKLKGANKPLNQLIKDKCF